MPTKISRRHKSALLNKAEREANDAGHITATRIGLPQVVEIIRYSKDEKSGHRDDSVPSGILTYLSPQSSQPYWNLTFTSGRFSRCTVSTNRTLAGFNVITMDWVRIPSPKKRTPLSRLP